MLRRRNVRLVCRLGPRTPFILKFLVSILAEIPVGVVRRLGRRAFPYKEGTLSRRLLPPSLCRPSPPSYSVALALLRSPAFLAEVELLREDPLTLCRSFHQHVCPLRAHTVIGVWVVPSHKGGHGSIPGIQ